MFWDLGDGYLWMKALHMISAISWMAGLLYMPRLFVYHTQATVGSDGSERFKIMERRLLWAIMHPALVATTLFGVLLWGHYPDPLEPWMWLKIAGLVTLYGVHYEMGRWRVAFAEDRNQRSEKFYRIMNEVPTLAMIVVVIAAVVKPF